MILRPTAIHCVTSSNCHFIVHIIKIWIQIKRKEERKTNIESSYKKDAHVIEIPTTPLTTIHKRPHLLTCHSDTCIRTLSFSSYSSQLRVTENIIAAGHIQLPSTKALITYVYLWKRIHEPRFAIVKDHIRRARHSVATRHKSTCCLEVNEGLNFYSSLWKQKTMIIMKAERVLNLETRARDGCLVDVKRIVEGGGDCFVLAEECILSYSFATVSLVKKKFCH